MTHADVIYQQLGGRKFAAMTGSTFTTADNGRTLNAKFKMSQTANMVKITYNQGMDLYDVTFMKVRGTSVKVVKELDMVYDDQLRHIFESVTGLYTSL